MAETPRPPRPPRRPVVGSRNPTGRPRSVAGRRPEASEPTAPVAEDAAEASPAPEAAETTAPPVVPEPPDEPARAAAGDDAEPPATRSRLLTSGRTTVVLVVALVLMSGVLASEAWYLWFKGEPVVSASRPVVTGEIAHRAAVESARQGVTDILSYGYQDFDKQIDEATSLMTDSFADEFRQTAEDVKQEFVAEKTEQDIRVVAASVVQASSQQVRALLFLDQYVVKGAEGTSVTPYRALVTMVHTEGGWLVSDIETK